MDSYTRDQILGAFRGATRSEVKKVTFAANFDAVDFGKLDFYGWIDPKIPRRAYVLVDGPDGPVALLFLTVGDRRIAAGIHVEDGDRLMFYNAGIDPDARELSPGVVLTAECLRIAIAMGKTRFDFLRGNEPYKYEWGALDEPIQRVLVRREAARTGGGR